MPYLLAAKLSFGNSNAEPPASNKERRVLENDSLVIKFDSVT